jgi:hypothetical protein
MKLTRYHGLLAGVALFLVFSAPAGASVRLQYYATLSNFLGPVPYTLPRLSIDRANNEVFAVDPRGRDVRIFNSVGMETYRFTPSPEMGNILDVAVSEDGDIYAVTLGGLYLCDYMGEPQSKIVLQGLPAEFAGFKAQLVSYRDGLLYLADTASMRIVITDGSGAFKKGYDIAELMDLGEKEKEEAELGGFSVDAQGSMYFTVPILFVAFKLSPEGELYGIGGEGTKGKFGIATGIVTDDSGNIYVSDSLQMVIMVFDRERNFLMAFDADSMGGLRVPRDLAIDGRGKLYISQGRRRGVSVYSISYNR